MKIIIVTQDAPMYLPQFLDRFISLVKKKHQIDRLICLSAVFNKNLFKEAKERFNLYGLTDFCKMTLLILKNKARGFSVDNVAVKHRLDYIKIKNINSPKFIDYIKKEKIDLIVSAAASRIFKKELLLAPKYGCINYHTGLLPKYRGRQPLFWAMLNDEKEVGISVFEMDEKLDNGPIIVQAKVSVGENDSLHDMYLKTIDIGPELLFRGIEGVLGNKRIENDENRASFYSFPKKADGLMFRKKGKKFF